MRTKHSLAALAASALLAVALGASSATAVTSDHDVRPGDLTTGDAGYATSDTRATGHKQFLKEGLHVWTEGATPTDKVAEYFPVNKPLAGITTIGVEWFGTATPPGQQYVMDFDNDGTQDGILVGENGYGGQDVWLSNGSKDAYKGEGAPSNTGGSGSANHGTLAEWSAKYPNAKILFGGFSLGSGVKGDGVLRSLTYGQDRYVFTSESAAVEQTSNAVTGSGVFSNTTGKASFRLTSDARPQNDTGNGKRIFWEIKVDGVLVYSSANTWGDATTWTYRFAAKSGYHKVQVYKNTELYKQASVAS